MKNDDNIVLFSLTFVHLLISQEFNHNLNYLISPAAGCLLSCGSACGGRKEEGCRNGEGDSQSPGRFCETESHQTDCHDNCIWGDSIWC